MKPLLLLDVDGVLNPTGGGVPRGFERTTINGYELTWSPQHRVWLGELSDLFDPVWATTWEHHANRSLSPLLGLPQLPVIEFDRSSQADTRKLPTVERWVGERALAWVDDQLFPDAFDWADNRSAPTLLLRPPASLGLTEDHVVELREFVESLGEQS